MIDVVDVLKVSDFGQRVAEEEADDLHKYFVETDNWAKLVSGQVDIVYGPKGAGKSALYSLLVQNRDALFDRGILLIAGENPRGATAFKNIASDPPDREEVFVGLWKLYILNLINQIFIEYGINNSHSQLVRDFLTAEGLAERESSLATKLVATYEYVKSFFTREVESIETGLNFDSILMLPTGVTGKITFREPGANQRKNGFTSVDSLFSEADKALSKAGYSAWVLLDRLDVAFTEHPDLEKNALRALFRVYLDLSVHRQIDLKVFLRTDIWRRISEDGFREGSHITRHVTISWSEAAARNLIIRRLINNESIKSKYKIDSVDILSSIDKQKELFFRVFPQQIDIGEKKPSTFDWLLSRTFDAGRQFSPREIIHFMNVLRQEQVKRLETGHAGPEGECLFERQTFKEALPEVSKVRLEQTLYAEYPSLKVNIEQLRGQKTSQSLDSLSAIWSVQADKASSIALSLVEVGFFEKRGDRTNPIYWVPFLYRDSLELSQGSADAE